MSSFWHEVQSQHLHTCSLHDACIQEITVLVPCNTLGVRLPPWLNDSYLFLDFLPNPSSARFYRRSLRPESSQWFLISQGERWAPLRWIKCHLNGVVTLPWTQLMKGTQVARKGQVQLFGGGFLNKASVLWPLWMRDVTFTRFRELWQLKNLGFCLQDLPQLSCWELLQEPRVSDSPPSQVCFLSQSVCVDDLFQTD